MAHRRSGSMNMSSISFEVRRCVGVITLNRPTVLNCLNLEMIKRLKACLHLWESDPHVHFVIIKSDLEKAFCAGGDLKEVYEAAHRQDHAFLETFFEEEYSLNQMIFSYKKPYVSLMQGITMGGGMGITAHGSHRIVTDNSVLAMPEVFIGFFPDAGASYFLNKCPGKIGLLMGLSGYRMNAADALYTGVATHYVTAQGLNTLFHALVETDISQNPREGIQAILEIFSSVPAMISPLEKNRAQIDDYFQEENISDLLIGLRLSKSHWIQEIRKKMEEASPLSLAITHHLFKKAKGLSFSEAMHGELRLALKFFQNTEVLEGIRSVVIDKDRNPEWMHKSIVDVPESVVHRYFD